MTGTTHHVSFASEPCEAIINRQDSIRVDLPENATSGYRWQLPPHVKLDGLVLLDQHVAYSNENPSSGTRTFVFRPTDDAQNSSLEFRLKRPAEMNQAPLQQFAITISVNDTTH